jgi:branched-chain amino acid transport system substrate-binding protein
LLCALPSIALAAPAPEPKPLSGQPVVIGAILSTTGNYAPLGEPERNALKLAERDINARGGIGGRPLQITIADDEGKADTAAQLATSLVGQGVPIVIGGSITPTSLAISRVTSAAKVVQIYMTPTSQIWNTKNGIAKYVFEVTPRNELEAPKLLAFAKTRLGVKKIALLHDDAPYGTQGAAIVTEAAKTADLPILADESFPVTATDLTAQLGRIKASGADAILLWTASPAAALSIRQMRQLGVTQHVIGSTGIVSDNFLRITGKDGDGVFADLDLDVTHPNEPQKAFLAAYRAEYKARPSNFASFAWDAAHLAALALTKANGKFDGDAIADTLSSISGYQGTTGTYRFSATDHNGLSMSDVHEAIDCNAIWFTLGPNDKLTCH